MKVSYSHYDHGKIEAKDREMSGDPGPRNALRVFYNFIVSLVYTLCGIYKCGPTHKWTQ